MKLRIVIATDEPVTMEDVAALARTLVLFEDAGHDITGVTIDAETVTTDTPARKVGFLTTEDAA